MQLEIAVFLFVQIILLHTKPLFLGLANLCYCQNSNISHILVDNKLVDHSDVVGAVPVILETWQ